MALPHLKKKKKPRRWIWITVAAVLFFILMVPTMLSTRSGKEWFVSHLNEELPGIYQVKEWSIGWFSDQKIDGLLWKDTAKGTQVTVDSIRINRGLLPLLLFAPSIGDSTAQGLKVIVQERGLSFDESKEEESKQKEKDPAEEFLSKWTGSLTVDGGSAKFLQGDQAVISLDELHFYFQNEGNGHPIVMDTRGTSRLEDLQGKFDIKGELKTRDAGEVEQWVNPLLRTLFPYHQISLNASIDNFPTQAVDQLVNLIKPKLYFGLEKAIGPTLTLKLNKIAEKNQVHYIFDVLGQNIKGDGELVLKEKSVQVIEPLDLTWTITPEWFQTIEDIHPLPHPITLLEPWKMSIDLRELDISLDKEGQDAWGAFQVSFSPTEFIDTESKETFKLSKLEIVSRFSPEERRRDLSAQIEAAWRDKDIRFSIKGQNTEGTWTPFCFEKCLQGEWDVELKEIPLQMFRYFDPDFPKITPYIGQNLNASFHIKELDNFSQVLATVQTEAFDASNIELAVSDMVSLLKPAKISLQLPDPTKDFWEEELPIVLTNKLIELDLKELSFDTTAFDKEQYTQFLDSLEFMGIIKGAELSLGLEKDEVPAYLTSLEFIVEKHEKQPIKVVLNSDISFLDPLYTNWLGESLHIEGDFLVKVNEKNHWVVDPFSLNIDSKNLQAYALGVIQGNYFTLKSPLTIIYTLTPSVYSSIFAENPHTTLVESSKITLTIDKLGKPIYLKKPFASHFSGRATINEFALMTQSNDLATAKDMEIDFDVDGLQNEINLIGTAKTTLGQDNGMGSSDFELTLLGWHDENKLTLDTMCMGGKVEMSAFPTLLLSPYLPYNVLEPLLGDHFSISIVGQGQCGDEAEGTLMVDMKSPTTTLSTHFKMGQDFLRLYATPGRQNKLITKLTPANFLQLMHLVDEESQLSLSAPFTVELNFDKLFVPYTLEKGFSSLFTQTIGSGDVTISKISLVDQRNNQKLNLQGLFGSISIPKITEPLELILATEKAAAKSTTSPTVDLEAKIFRQPDAEGQFDIKKLNGNIRFQGRYLPLGVLSELFLMPSTVQAQTNALMGNRADIDANLQLKRGTGLISLQVQGEHSKANLKGRVTDGTLYLTEPLTASIDMTPAVSKSVIGEIVPLLDTAISGNQPIQITISDEDFSLPLDPFDPLKAQISSGKIDLGVISLIPEKDLAELFTLLKIKSGSSSSLETIWFTPLYFSLSNGVFQMKRVDMLLANKFPLALWGKVDFNKDKVQLTFGFGAKTLLYAFGIKGLPNDYYLTVPIKGTTKKARIDKTKATVKIGSLIAKVEGSAPGELISNVIDLVTGAFKEEDVPPPTTSPLPWEEGAPKTEEKKSNKVQSLFKTIEKGAKSLKNILPN